MIDEVKDPAIDRYSRTLIFGELEVRVDYLQVSGKLWYVLIFKTSISPETFIVRWLDMVRGVEIENFDGSEKYIIKRLTQYGLVWECEGFKAPEWIMAFCKFLIYRKTPEFIKNKAKGGDYDEVNQEAT